MNCGKLFLPLDDTALVATTVLFASLDPRPSLITSPPLLEEDAGSDWTTTLELTPLLLGEPRSITTWRKTMDACSVALD